MCRGRQVAHAEVSMEWKPGLLGSPHVWGRIKIVTGDGSYKQLKVTFDFWAQSLKLCFKIILSSVGWLEEREEEQKLISLFQIFRWYWLCQQKKMWSVRTMIDWIWTKKEESEIILMFLMRMKYWRTMPKHSREEGDGLHSWHVKFPVTHKKFMWGWSGI